MRHYIIFTIALAAITLALGNTSLAQWMFKSSYYSHEPVNGVRTAQYTAALPAYREDDGTFQRSCYRQNRSSLRVGGSADHIHIVETWGQGEAIRPYGEWLRPFRAGATPYGPWGNASGPWTTPFGSWVNPYGVGKIPHNYNFNHKFRHGGQHHHPHFGKGGGPGGGPPHPPQHGPGGGPPHPPGGSP